MNYFPRVGFFMLIAAAIAVGDEQLSPPSYKASLVCFNGKDGEGSSCRSTMAKIDGPVKTVTGGLTCGFPGAVSEITWTYRGQKDGKDLYHVVRKFPVDGEAPQTTEVDVSFDGQRKVLFQDKAQCVVIELEPAKR